MRKQGHIAHALKLYFVLTKISTDNSFDILTSMSGLLNIRTIEAKANIEFDLISGNLRILNRHLMSKSNS